jgi:predicted nucleic acid-binding Zn finger protein
MLSSGKCIEIGGLKVSAVNGKMKTIAVMKETEKNNEDALNEVYCVCTERE